MFRKVVASSVVLASLVSGASNTFADTYEEISCSTDPVFAENSCNQCFNGWEKAQNSTVGWLSDLWVNSTSAGQILFKEVNDINGAGAPVMKALNGAVWNKDSAEDNFWRYTDAVEKLYDSKQEGYILKAGQKVDWIESTTGSSYELTNNPVAAGQNNGLLIYSLIVNPILENGEVATDTETHKECVLFKSADKPVTPVNKPKELPKTWPEQFFLLLLIAMFLAFGVLRFKNS